YIEPYLETKKPPELKPRTYIQVKRHLMNKAKPLHNLTPAALESGDDLRRLFEKVTKESGRTAANHMKSAVSAFVAWMIERGLMKTNPAGNITKHKSTKRDRVLSADELKMIWRALPSDEFGDICKLLLLTGNRRDEIGCLRWGEVKVDHILL